MIDTNDITKKKLLLEDFIDDLSDEELGSETVSAERDKPYEHKLIWLVSFRSRSDAANSKEVIDRLCKTVLTVVDRASFITEFSGKLGIIDPQEEKLNVWPQVAKHRIEKPLASSCPSSVLDTLISYMEEKKAAGL